ncbi:MAG TPA: hypothetical protein VIL85_23205 [Thermomicrobiales bacterium]
MVEKYDRRFAEVAHLFKEWRPRGEQRAPSPLFTMSGADDAEVAARAVASPPDLKPHEIPATAAGDETIADQLSESWAAQLATRVVARDPETLRELDLPPHDRAVAAALRALQAALPPEEQHRIRALVEAIDQRELNLINLVGYMGWDAGYATAVEAYTGAPPQPLRKASDQHDEREAE